MTTRILLWMSAASFALSLDLITKAVPHQVYAYNYAHTPLVVFIGVALFLGILGTRQSKTLAVGTGLMFGGLCGNAGQLFLDGYATDWIPIHGWLTNMADIAGGAGLLCCLAGFVVPRVQRDSARD